MLSSRGDGVNTPGSLPVAFGFECLPHTWQLTRPLECLTVTLPERPVFGPAQALAWRHGSRVDANLGFREARSIVASRRIRTGDIRDDAVWQTDTQ